MSIPHSIYQRSIDLAGEIKLAGQLVAECEQAEAIKTDELAIAVGNTQRQRDNLARLLAERETLAAQAAEAILTGGGPATDHAPVEASVFDLDAPRASGLWAARSDIEQIVSNG